LPRKRKKGLKKEIITIPESIEFSHPKIKKKGKNKDESRNFLKKSQSIPIYISYGNGESVR